LERVLLRHKNPIIERKDKPADCIQGYSCPSPVRQTASSSALKQECAGADLLPAVVQDIRVAKQISVPVEVHDIEEAREGFHLDPKLPIVLLQSNEADYNGSPIDKHDSRPRDHTEACDAALLSSSTKVIGPKGQSH
jgi:hypothetical protein